jgi:hypothetical protein
MIKRWLIFKHPLDNVYNPHQVWGSLLFKKALNTWTHMDYISTKISLENYDSVADLRKHMWNLYNSLKLVI